MLLWVQHIALVVILGLAAFWDCRFQRIPNWLNLAGLGLAVAVVAGARITGAETRVDDALLGLVIAGGVMLFLYLGGGLGGGDVKLAPAFGLLAGYPDVVRYLFYGGLAALALILGRLAWRGELGGHAKRICRKPFRVLNPGAAQEAAATPETAPAATSFALALLIGVVWVWLMREL